MSAEQDLHDAVGFNIHSHRGQAANVKRTTDISGASAHSTPGLTQDGGSMTASSSTSTPFSSGNAPARLDQLMSYFLDIHQSKRATRSSTTLEPSPTQGEKANRDLESPGAGVQTRYTQNSSSLSLGKASPTTNSSYGHRRSDSAGARVSDAEEGAASSAADEIRPIPSSAPVSGTMTANSVLDVVRKSRQKPRDLKTPGNTRPEPVQQTRRVSERVENELPVDETAYAVASRQNTRQQELEPLEKLATQIITEPLAPTTTIEVKKSKRLLAATKVIFAASQITLNAFFIFGTWYWSKYYYIYLPFITITVALNCLMVISVCLHKIVHMVFPEKKILPDKPESLVFLLPCYNETKEECTKSLDSLVDQVNIDRHKRAIMIVCDGRVRGKGMEKTCADYLLEDILTDNIERKVIPAAYTAWNTEPNDITMQRGVYKGIPYMCLVKNRNLGKRDGLILVRSFLYTYNMRRQKPDIITSPKFFAEMTCFLEHDARIDDVTFLCGMDADTVFADDCVEKLLEESRYKDTVGVCGYVAVDFSTGSWDIWSLYQSTEYTISQGLRRLHQSIATHKVSCLPGCCQLLRICEATCGTEVLLQRFGYFPRASDAMLKQIRATASEDRNHVCLMLSTRPKSQTRQALRAHAYTDVPHSWSVFLSQRRRWTLGATSNDLLLVTAPGVNWFERILAAANVLTWVLNPFILASIASFIIACTRVKYWIILSFSSVMIAPLVYYVLIALWLPRGVRPRIQYLLGLVYYIFLGPFLNIAVLMYALWNMDNFGWGKTRKVVEDGKAEGKGDAEKKQNSTSENVQLDERTRSWPLRVDGVDFQTVAGQIERPQRAMTRGYYDEEKALGR